MKLKSKKISLLILTLTLGLVTMLGLSTTKVFANFTGNIIFLDKWNDNEIDLENGVYYFEHHTDGIQLVRVPSILEEEGDFIYKSLTEGFHITINSTTNSIFLDKWNDNEIDLENGVYYFEHHTDGIQLVRVPSILEEEGDFIYKSLTEGFHITFSYQDNKSPVVSGETTFVSNVADPKDASYFMQFLSAYDETDGDVTDSLKIIQDNYTANKSKLGNHTFTVEASDKSGNNTTSIINVRVVDIDKPIITGNTTTATIGYKETYNIENFRKTLAVTDNYDKLTNADIKVKSDNYTANKTKLGTYTIVFTAKDSSGNEGTFSKDIKVIDNVKPTFSGPSVISTSNNTILTEAEIRAQITAHDDIDGNITNRIELVEDNYTGNGNKVGSYTIKYSVKDNANNIEYYVITIQRTDKIPPIILVEDGVSIRTNVDTPITYEIIIDILQATGQITVNASTTFSFPLDEYTGNDQEPGIYAMSVKARSTNGNESIFNMSIVVYDTEDDGGIDVNPDFDLGVWFNDNYVYVIVGAVALLGVGFLVYQTTRRKRR